MYLAHIIPLIVMGCSRGLYRFVIWTSRFTVENGLVVAILGHLMRETLVFGHLDLTRLRSLERETQ